MASLKDKISNYIKAKVAKVRYDFNRPREFSPAVNKAVQFGQGFSSGFQQAVPGKVTETILNKMKVPIVNPQTSAGRTGNVVGNIASTMFQGVGAGKVLKPLFGAPQAKLGKTAGKIIAKGGTTNKILGKGVANISQGLPYTASFNLLNRANNPQTNTGGNVLADVGFDFATGMLPIVGMGGMALRKSQIPNDKLIEILRSGKGSYDRVSGLVKMSDGAGNKVNLGRLSKKAASNAIDFRSNNLADAGGKKYEGDGSKLFGKIQEGIQQGGNAGTSQKRYPLGREALFNPTSQGYKDIRGGSASTPEEIGGLLKDFRNPKEEVLHLVYTKNGKVVAHNALTSKVVDGVRVDPKEMLNGIGERVDRLSADGVYMAHNHPSGEPDLSDADMAVFKQLRKRFGEKMKALVVMDHDSVGVGEMKNGKITASIKNADLGKSFKSTGVPITNKVVLTDYAREYYKPDGKSVGVFITDSQNRPVAYEKFNGVGKSVEQLNDTIRQFARKHRGARVFTVMPDGVARNIDPAEFQKLGTDEVLISKNNDFENAGYLFSSQNLQLDRNLNKVGGFLFDKPSGVKELKANSRVADTNIRPVQESLPKVNISPQQVGKATTAPIQPKQSLPTQQAGGGGLSGGIKNPSLSGIIPQNDPVQKIISALKKAKPIRGGQEAMYSKARGQKFAKLMSTRGKTGGESGYFKELGTLKGELPKANFESIRNQLNQGDIDSLFDKVNVANIGEWEKLTAKSGLAKLLGKEGTSVPTKGELAKLHDVFGKEFTQTLLDKRGNWQKLADLAGDVLNLPRSMMASFDLSAPLRQGIFLVGKPKQWGDSFLTMFEAFFSKDAQKSVFENISSRPTYKLMREHRLGLTDPDSILGNKEEMFMSNLAERIPGIKIGIKASDRAYSTFLNKLRADTFDDIYARGKDLGIAGDPEFLKSVASFVNNATGRGELPAALASSAKTLNGLMFSPKLMASRLNLLNPVYYAKLHPTVRKEALKSLFTFASAGMTVATLASLAGAEVGTDPRNSDFGKVKVGNTRYDIWGGFQQYIKIASQLITGKLISSTTGKEYTLGEGYKPLTRLGILSKFMQSKQSPVVGFVLGLLEGKNAIGDDFKPTQELLDRFIPMVISDMYDLQKEWGPKGILMGMPAIFGVGSQTYGRQFPVQETTETGKPTIKMRGETGLAEDVVNSISSTPKTTIPQNQWEDIRTKKQSETNLAIARDKVKQSQQIEQTDDYYVYFDKDSGETRSIKKNPDLTPPKLTGQTELDKEILSDYKSSITRRVNDIVKLYDLGQMTSEQAEEEIGKLSILKEMISQVTKSNKPKKISVRRGTVPKIKSTKPKTASLKAFKPSNKAKFNVKTVQPTNYKVSKADLDKLRTGNV